MAVGSLGNFQVIGLIDGGVQNPAPIPSSLLCGGMGWRSDGSRPELSELSDRSSRIASHISSLGMSRLVE